MGDVFGFPPAQVDVQTVSSGPEGQPGQDVVDGFEARFDLFDGFLVGPVQAQQVHAGPVADLAAELGAALM